MSSPPTKRQRTDSDGAEMTRSEIWHLDGSIILQAHKTQFRVHWSVLSLHSSFFRDMQGLPQPDSPDQPSIDGCPIIEVSDSAEDVKHLLKTLYDPLFFLQVALPLPVIASHIRLGRKYDFKDILSTVVERLTDEFPASLEDYDALRPQSHSRIIRYRGITLDTITLARENNLLSVLPCAYLQALFFKPEAIFDGVARPDGSLSLLSSNVQRTCSLARVKILGAQWAAGNTLGWVSETATGCTNIPYCASAKSSRLHGTVVKGLLHPFMDITSIDPLELCAACSEDAKTKMTAGRKKMWELLPSFFDLPPWSELKNDL
ncbi:hypothetical protein C8R43DRAFT_551540 [Mycena crocata]|nr:hypothetical protein C8R43DRAFT_551540 [Mycena crocata]